MTRDLALGLWLVLLGLGAALQLPLLFQQFHGRPLLFAFLMLVLGGIALVQPRAAIAGAFVFLAVLGDFRRYVGSVLGFVGTDLLLLVGPAVALLLLLGPLAGDRLRLDSRLSWWVLVLMAWMVAQMFNPAQGGLAVGFAGALFYLVPLLWYWIGKSYATPALVEFIAFRVVLPVAVAASLLGLYQAYFGLLPFEQAWVEAVGYEALWIADGVVRPIAFFTSSAEYAHYLSIALVFAWAGLLRGRPTWMLAVPLLVVALFVASTRGPIVTTLFTIVVLWAVQGRSRGVWLPRLALALAVGVAGLIFALTQVGHGAFGDRTEALVAHQVEGLLNPLDPERSTAGLHLAMMANGFIEGFKNPVGMGLGFTTLAAARFGDGGGSTEVDLSNVMVSLGLPGGIMYAAIIVIVLLTAVRYWLRTRSLAGLLILGALVVMLRSWLVGGEYAITALIWFLIGALDRFDREVHHAARPRRA